MSLKPAPLLWSAIEHRCMIRLVCHGKHRVVEPHDHGILNGSVQLLGYQIAGSSSRPLPNWILMKVTEMEGLPAGGPPLPANTFAGTSCSSESNLPTDRLDPSRPNDLHYPDLGWPDAYDVVDVESDDLQSPVLNPQPIVI